MHHYPHHVGDYQRDTALLTVTEHGAYRLLMDAYYVTERPLPADHATLCRLCRAVSKTERDAVATVMAAYFREQDGALRHKRIERELGAYQKRGQKAVEAGVASGEARRAKKTHDDERLFIGSSTPDERPFAPSSTPGELTSTQEPEPETSTQALQSSERAGAFPSLEEVKAQGDRVMAPPACAERFWNDCEAVGWVNRHGQPIADWRPLFRNFASQWRANEAQQKARNKHHPHRHSHANHPSNPPRSDAANMPGRYTSAIAQAAAAARASAGA